MKKRLFHLVLGLFLPVFAFSQASFERTYGTGSGQFEQLHLAEPLADGGLILAGYKLDSTTGDYDSWWLRTDVAGQILWQKRSNSVDKNDGPIALEKSADGHFLMAITTIEDQSTQSWVHSHRILKFDADGTTIWSQDASAYPEIADLAASADGGCAFVYSLSSSPVVVKLSGATGQTVWSKTPFSTFGMADFLTETPDGGYLFGGRENNVGTVVRLNSAGQNVWKKAFADSLSNPPAILFPIRAATVEGGFAFLTTSDADFEARHLIKIDWAGDFVFQEKLAVSSGLTFSGDEIKVLADSTMLVLTKNSLFHLESDGTLIKEIDFDGPINPFLNAVNDLVIQSSGEIEVAGNHQNAGDGFDGGVLTLNDNLVVSFAKPIGDGLPSDAETAWAVREAPDGGLFVAGQRSFAGTGSDFSVFRTDPFGNVVWEKNFGQAGQEFCYSLDALADGNLLMTGRREKAPMNEVVLMKISPSGDLIWEKSHALPNLTSQTKALERPDGSLFVFYRSGQRAWAMRTTAAGDSLWTRKINNSSGVREAINAADGSVAAVGWLSGNATSGHFFRMTDAGNFLAQAFLEGGQGIAYGLVQMPSGDFLVSGFADIDATSTDNGDSLFVQKITPAGQKVFEKFFNQGAYHIRPRLARATDGGYFLSGSAQADPSQPEDNSYVFVQKLDAQVESVWTNIYGGIIEYDFVFDSRGMTDGGLAVVGSGGINGSGDTYVLRIAPDGSVKTFEIKPLGQLKITPNPTDGPFVLTFESEKTGQLEITFFNEKGQLLERVLAEKTGRVFEKTFAAEHLKTGISVVRVSMNGQSISRSLVRF